MAKPELGAKQICPNCSAKFYDLGRRPAHCPKCATEFDPEEALKSRRVRARSVTPDYEADDEPEAKKVVEPEGFEDEPDDTPEIDEAAEADPVVVDEDAVDDPGVPAAPADDLGVDFAEEELAEEEEADDGVPFLEDEDEDFPEDEIEGLPGEGDEDR